MSLCVPEAIFSMLAFTVNEIQSMLIMIFGVKVKITFI